MTDTTVNITAVNQSVNVSGTPGVSVIVTGVPGVSGKDGNISYTHTQSTPSSVWTINHNLGRYPSIQLLSVGGVEFFGTITNTSINQAIVNLTVAVAGIAQCN